MRFYTGGQFYKGSTQGSRPGFMPELQRGSSEEFVIRPEGIRPVCCWRVLGFGFSVYELLGSHAIAPVFAGSGMAAFGVDGPSSTCSCSCADSRV